MNIALTESRENKEELKSSIKECITTILNTPSFNKKVYSVIKDCLENEIEISPNIFPSHFDSTNIEFVLRILDLEKKYDEIVKERKRAETERENRMRVRLTGRKSSNNNLDKEKISGLLTARIKKDGISDLIRNSEDFRRNSILSCLSFGHSKDETESRLNEITDEIVSTSKKEHSRVVLKFSPISDSANEFKLKQVLSCLFGEEDALETISKIHRKSNNLKKPETSFIHANSKGKKQKIVKDFEKLKSMVIKTEPIYSNDPMCLLRKF